MTSPRTPSERSWELEVRLFQIVHVITDDLPKLGRLDVSSDSSRRNSVDQLPQLHNLNPLPGCVPLAAMGQLVNGNN
jgi:hypothetical protein